MKQLISLHFNSREVRLTLGDLAALLSIFLLGYGSLLAGWMMS